MKLIRRVGFIVAIFFLMAGAIPSGAQIVVRVRPVIPHRVVVRPAAPSRVHVWIDEDWAWRNGRYEFAGGRWEAPPHPGSVWIPGHWRENRRGGWVWVPGHWRMRH